MRSPPLYVARTPGVVDVLEEDQPTTVLSFVELLETKVDDGVAEVRDQGLVPFGSAPPEVRARLPVATSPRSKFVTLGDAVESAPDVRDALLGLAPDPALDRWGRPPVRLILLLAPISWGYFVYGDVNGLNTL